MKVIFLDCDGVLNNMNTTEVAPVGHLGVDEENFQYLIQLVKETKSKIVLTSTWQEEKGMLKYLKKKLFFKGILLKDITHENTICRGRGIRKYIETHDVESYVVLDDFEFPDFKSEGIMDHFVQVSYFTGLTEFDIKKAKYILNKKII